MSTFSNECIFFIEVFFEGYISRSKLVNSEDLAIDGSWSVLPYSFQETWALRGVACLFPHQEGV